MEGRVAALERWTSENGKIILEIQENLHEIRNMIKNSKKSEEGSEKSSENGENSVNNKKGVVKMIRKEESDSDSEEEVQKQWMKRVELPTFEGSDPMGWIARAEKFFEIQNISPKEKLRLAFISMEGNASHWFSFWKKKSKNPSWESFVEALNKRFGGKDRSTVFEKLASIRQNEGVEEYVQEFERLVAQIPDLSEEQLLGYFFAGLQSRIRSQVKPHDPRDLMRAMEISRDVEESLNESWAGRTNTYRTTSAADTRFQRGMGVVSRTETFKGAGNSQSSPSNMSTARKEGGGTSSMGSRTSGNPTTGGSKNRAVRNLPYPEYLKRREEGRCFHCGGAFGPGHRCPEKSLRVVILAEDEENSEGREEDGGEERIGVLENKRMELSLFSAGGLTQNNTMKLQGDINGRKVLILIDSGASHNFVSAQLVTELGLMVEDTPPYCVRLGDGHKKQTQGCCKDVEVNLENHVVKETFFLFELGGVDVILGVEWLASLGEVKVNWNTLTMSFNVAGKVVNIQGDPTLTKRIVTPQALLKETEIEAISLVWELGLTSHEEEEGGKGLSAKQQEELEEVLQEHKIIFQEKLELPPRRGIDHKIPIKVGENPVNVRPYRYPHLLKSEIEKQVEEMLKSGIIRPSNSPYSSPVILVKKKDGSWRFCIDYRALNKVTVADKFPIPVIEELLDELHGATYFSKVDLKAGYHQIRMYEGDIQKTAFRTHQGHYEFLVMPFGLTNAPATFQCAMNTVLQPYLRKFVLVFFDDILIYSQSWEDHMGHLKQVLHTLQQQQFFANKKKCEFGRQEVKYLGHVISKKGVEMDQDKLAAIHQWPLPKNLKALRGFLGLTGYYRRFIRDYGKVAKPLTRLLKKGCFCWNEESTKAMEALKKAITTAPVLKLPDFSQPFSIECDASGSGLGAVLTQDKRPIAFFSKGLSDTSLTKSIYEKELMALVLAIQHWRPYLLGQKFTVYTDQRSLRYLLEQRITTQNQQNWLAKLMGYEFNIVYKIGASNKVADALSRRGENEEDDKELTIMSIPFWQDFQKILAEVEEDAELQKIIKGLKENPGKQGQYTLEHGRLHHKGRLVLSANSAWIPRLLAEYHTTSTGGHSGVFRTYRRISQSLYWIGMKKMVTDFVAACLVCQQHKYLASSPQGLLQPLPIPNAVWEDISLDFIVRLPKSNGYDSVLVVVDRLSKYGHFIPIKHPYSAKSIAEVFAKEIVRLHGIPASIVSDRDPTFLSLFWKELFRMQGTQLNMSTAYHPESDGQTEVLNRTLETYLRCFSSEQPKSWSHFLSWAEYWYNTSFHGAAQKSPFEIVYGRPPPSISRFIPGETIVEAVAQDLMTRDEALSQLKFHLARAQEHMTKYANKHRKQSSIQVGDWVFLKIRPHRQVSMPTRLHPKLSARYYGPFLVLKQVGPVAFGLQLPETARIHPVFHVSQLKKAVGTHQVEKDLPEGLQGRTSNWFPEKILDNRWGPIPGKEDARPQVLIQWKDKGVETATWEDVTTIQQQFPDFNLEDKVAQPEGSNDRILKVYVRRNKN